MITIPHARGINVVTINRVKCMRASNFIYSLFVLIVGLLRDIIRRIFDFGHCEAILFGNNDRIQCDLNEFEINLMDLTDWSFGHHFIPSFLSIKQKKQSNSKAMSCDIQLGMTKGHNFSYLVQKKNEEMQRNCMHVVCRSTSTWLNQWGTYKHLNVWYAH